MKIRNLINSSINYRKKSGVSYNISNDENNLNDCLMRGLTNRDVISIVTPPLFFI